MKKLLLLSGIGLLTLTISSCSPSEKTLDNEEGNEIVTQAVEKTSKKLQAVASQNVISMTFDTVNNASLNVKTQDITATDDANAEQRSVLASAKASFQANVDTDGLRQTPNADWTNTEVYAGFEASAEITNPNGLEPAEKTKKYESAQKVYFKGLDYVTYTKDNENEGFNSGTDLVEDGNRLASTVVEVLDYLKAAESQKPELDLEQLPVESGQVTIVQGVVTNLNSYFNGTMTAEQFVDYLDTLVAPGQLTLYKDVIIDVLEIAKEVNPTKYFEFTKKTEKKVVTLSASLNYASWKTDLSTKLNTKLDEITNKVSTEYMMLNMVKTVCDIVLPASMTFDQTITLHADGYIQAYALSTSFSSAIETNVINGLLASTGISLDENKKISYEATLNTSFALNFANNAVEVTKLVVPAK
ncbi:MAG: hypothetical protein MR270_00230 [Erysipelotrichaceae bacterium]|nr:hypothetical protein [Erysipelotrichaceae bacterium]